MIGTLFGHQSCPSTELATRAIDLGRPSHAPVYAVQMVNKCVLTRMALMCSAKDATGTTADGVSEDTGPEKAGLVGLIILLLVVLVGLLTDATVGFVIYRRKKTPEVEEDEEEQVEDVGDGMFSFFGW